MYILGNTVGCSRCAAPTPAINTSMRFWRYEWYSASPSNLPRAHHKYDLPRLPLSRLTNVTTHMHAQRERAWHGYLEQVHTHLHTDIHIYIYIYIGLYISHVHIDRHIRCTGHFGSSDKVNTILYKSTTSMPFSSQLHLQCVTGVMS